MHNAPSTGYVLHRIPYRETSYIVDLFTYEHGRVRGVAKGVRGSKSDRKSLLQPFQALHVIISGRNELKNIGRIEACSSPAMLTDKALYSAMYMNEILNRSLPEDLPVEAIFDDYQRTLQHLGALSRNENNISTIVLEPILRAFELNLLHYLGVLPDLTHDAQSHHMIEEDAVYVYHEEQGFIKKYEGVGDALSFRGKAILDMSSHDWNQQSLQCAKRFCRLALLPLIGEKPLKSRELFNQVR